MRVWVSGSRFDSQESLFYYYVLILFIFSSIRKPSVKQSNKAYNCIIVSAAASVPSRSKKQVLDKKFTEGNFYFYHR